MVVRLKDIAVAWDGSGGYSGMRMSADAYYELPDDGARYELIDGVVVMSPSPMPSHQDVGGEIYGQLRDFVKSIGHGRVFYEIDIRLAARVPGRDLIYRPDVIYFANQRVVRPNERLNATPDLVVEVASPGTRGRDLLEKRADYERCGILEYWLIDPADGSMTFLRLTDGTYVEVAPVSERFESVAVPGFSLDLSLIRRLLSFIE